MSPQLFSVISIVLNITLCIVILFRRYSQRLTITLFCAAAVFPLIPMVGIRIFTPELAHTALSGMFSLFWAGTVLLDEISSRFMRKNLTDIRLWRFVVPKSPILYGIGLIGILSSFVAPWELFLIAPDTLLINAGVFELPLLISLIGLSIYGLYQIEATYRFAMIYQRKIGHLCFLSFVILWVFNILFLGRILLYRIIDLNWILTSLSIYGVAYPILLLGLFRYRLSFEHVSVDRNTVYTSIVITLGGVTFTGVGAFIYFFRFFNIDRSYFEKSLLIVTFFAFATVIISSGGVRRWIITFVNRRFYSSKYNYREQFFHLYKTYVSGTNLEESLTGMVENMKYAVAAVDAFVFFKSSHTNSYVMHRNPEFATAERMVITGDEFPDSVFSLDGTPLYLQTSTEGKSAHTVFSSIPVISKLSPSVIFPIFNDGVLLGLLMIKLSDGRVLDQEDLALINVFTHSIGMVFYRNILANEKIEQEQFQSFHQVVSFVIHDIKNQVATLSLMARNAEQYIGDPHFQKSLIKSIKNSSDNLAALVEKLSEQRKAVNFTISDTGLLSVVEAALAQGSFAMFPEMVILWGLKEECSVSVDFDVMKNVVLNIAKNAVEAMASKGTLTISVGKVTSFHEHVLKHFGLAQNEFSTKKAVVIIEDTGPGMNQEFLDNWLFKPFITTKDKGMGIGLYQCKISVERMGGRIYCHSKVGEGTKFCVTV